MLLKHVRKLGGNKRNIQTCDEHGKFERYYQGDVRQAFREGVEKIRFLGLCPKHRTPPTHCARLGLHLVKNNS